MTEVVFALLPNVVLLDVAGPADAFRNAGGRGPGSYRLRFAAPQPRVQAAVGLQLGELEPLPERLAPGTLLVLAGVAKIDPHEPATQRLIEWLRSGVPDPALLLCVCSGSVLAARAGLLAGRECTTHHAHLEELRRAEPRARVLDNRIFVEDGPVFTSAGVTAGSGLAPPVIGRQPGGPGPAVGGRDPVVGLRPAGADPARSAWLRARH